MLKAGEKRRRSSKGQTKSREKEPVPEISLYRMQNIINSQSESGPLKLNKKRTRKRRNQKTTMHVSPQKRNTRRKQESKRRKERS